MREIKFRIYFEDEEPFMANPISIEDLLHEDWIEFENEDNTVSLPLKDFRFFYEKNKNYKIMQYIGRKDKNGKEIYEGDIVKGTFYGFPMVEYDYIFQIYWDEKEKGFMANYFEPSECEVIGNIYENPELLEER